MAVRIVDSGVGLFLPTKSFNPSSFSHAVTQILDPEAGFSRTAQQFRRLLLSNPAGLGRTHGADVIEDVLRRGYKHIVPREALTEPGWARAGLDVLILDVLLIVGSLWLTKMVIQTVWWLMWWVVRRAKGTLRWTGHGALKKD